MRRMRTGMWWRTILATGAVAGVLTAVVVAGPAGPAAGQEPPTSTTTTTTRPARPARPVPSVGAVAAAILEDGWYAHPEAVGDREQLDQVADRLTDRRHGIGFALLAAEPPGSSTRFAEDVLDELIVRSSIWYPGRTSTTTTSATTTTPGATTGSSVFRYEPAPDIRTVVVLSDEDVGVVSDRWGDAAIDAALDETIDELRADPTDGLEALADALADQPVGDDDPDEGDGEIPFAVIGVALFGLLAAAQIVFATVRTTGDDVDDSDNDSDSDRDGGDGGRSRRRRYNPLLSRPFSSGARIGGGSRPGSSGGGGSGGGSRGRGGRRL